MYAQQEQLREQGRMLKDMHKELGGKMQMKNARDDGIDRKMLRCIGAQAEVQKQLVALAEKSQSYHACDVGGIQSLVTQQRSNTKALILSLARASPPLPTPPFEPPS